MGKEGGVGGDILYETDKWGGGGGGGGDPQGKDWRQH